MDIGFRKSGDIFDPEKRDKTGIFEENILDKIVSLGHCNLD